MKNTCHLPAHNFARIGLNTSKIHTVLVKFSDPGLSTDIYIIIYISVNFVWLQYCINKHHEFGQFHTASEIR